MAESQEQAPITLTREELYKKVWVTPMRNLASHYGLSDTGLAKICRRYKIPYPARGYWAKKTANKKTSIEPLPQSDNANLQITLVPASIRQPEIPQEIRSQFEEARAKAGTVEISKRLSKPHGIIIKWQEEREKARKRARQYSDPWQRLNYDPGEFTVLDRHQHRILDSLFKILEKHGAKIGENEKGTLYAELLNEKIEFQLRDAYKQVKIPITEETKWRDHRNRGWHVELHSTGKFVFTIKTYLPRGLCSEWRESDRYPIESIFKDIVSTFLAAAPLLAEQTRKRGEREEQRRVEEMERYKSEQEFKKNKNRWCAFLDMATAWEEGKQARLFLEELRKSNIDLEEKVADKKLGEWIKWIEDQIEVFNPLSYGAKAIFSDISRINEWNYKETKGS